MLNKHSGKQFQKQIGQTILKRFQLPEMHFGPQYQIIVYRVI